MRKRQQKSFNNLGLSMIEVIIIVGLIAVIATGVSTVSKFGFDSLRGLRLARDTNAIADMAKVALARPPQNVNDHVCQDAITRNGNKLNSWGGEEVKNVDIVDKLSGRSVIGGMNTDPMNPAAGEVDVEAKIVAMADPINGGAANAAYTFQAIDPSDNTMKNFTYTTTFLEFTSTKKQSGIGGGYTISRLPIAIIRGPNGNRFYDCLPNPNDFESFCSLFGGRFDKTQNPQCLLGSLSIAKDWNVRGGTVSTLTPPNGIYSEGDVRSDGMLRSGDINKLPTTLANWSANPNLGFFYGGTRGSIAMGEAANLPGIGFDVGASPKKALLNIGTYNPLPNIVLNLRTFDNVPTAFLNNTGGVQSYFMFADPTPATYKGLSINRPANNLIPRTQLDVGGEGYIINNPLYIGDLTIARNYWAGQPNLDRTAGVVAVQSPNGDGSIYRLGFQRSTTGNIGFYISDGDNAASRRGAFEFVPSGVPTYLAIRAYNDNDIWLFNDPYPAPATPYGPTLAVNGTSRYVGMGAVTDPRAQLEVAGNAHFSNSVISGNVASAQSGLAGVGRTTADPGFIAGFPGGRSVFMGATGADEVGFTILEGNTRRVSVYATDGVPKSMDLKLYTAGDVIFCTNINPAPGAKCPLFINGATQNIGIGTRTPTERLHVAGGDLVVINGANLTCTIGNLAGQITCSSDERLKTNIQAILHPLEKVLSLRGVEFDWISKPQPEGPPNLGVIAQEVEKVFPTAVETDSDTGFKRVAMTMLISPLIGAIQELNKMISELNFYLQQKLLSLAQLEQENIQIQNKNISLRNRLNQLRNRKVELSPTFSARQGGESE